jgi:hypothetical protein
MLKSTEQIKREIGRVRDGIINHYRNEAEQTSNKVYVQPRRVGKQLLIPDDDDTGSSEGDGLDDDAFVRHMAQDKHAPILLRSSFFGSRAEKKRLKEKIRARQQALAPAIDWEKRKEEQDAEVSRLAIEQEKKTAKRRAELIAKRRAEETEKVLVPYREEKEKEEEEIRKLQKEAIELKKWALYEADQKHFVQHGGEDLIKRLKRDHPMYRQPEKGTWAEALQLAEQKLDDMRDLHITKRTHADAALRDMLEGIKNAWPGLEEQDEELSLKNKKAAQLEMEYGTDDELLRAMIRKM